MTRMTDQLDTEQALFDRAQAAESQLAKLREGLDGLVKKWNHGTTDQDCLYDKGLYYCADEIKSLLGQTAPGVNSEKCS